MEMAGFLTWMENTGATWAEMVPKFEREHRKAEALEEEGYRTLAWAVGEDIMDQTESRYTQQVGLPAVIAAPYPATWIGSHCLDDATS